MALEVLRELQQPIRLHLAVLAAEIIEVYIHVQALVRGRLGPERLVGVDSIFGDQQRFGRRLVV